MMSSNDGITKAAGGEAAAASAHDATMNVDDQSPTAAAAGAPKALRTTTAMMMVEERTIIIDDDSALLMHNMEEAQPQPQQQPHHQEEEGEDVDVHPEELEMLRKELVKRRTEFRRVGLYCTIMVFLSICIFAMMNNLKNHESDDVLPTPPMMTTTLSSTTTESLPPMIISSSFGVSSSSINQDEQEQLPPEIPEEKETTESPTTESPTTSSPTTSNPTTALPTSAMPTMATTGSPSAAPTTSSPTTENPTTVSPTTENPTTLSPTTGVPTTASPTTGTPTEGEEDTKEEDDDDGVVEVYILMGQSNMFGMGQVGNETTIDHDGTLQSAVHQKGLYPYLIDDGTNNNWTVSSTIRNVHVTPVGYHNKFHLIKNEFLTIHNNDLIGPELGIGHQLEQVLGGERKIMLLKSCAGNRGLGWDYLPPGSQRYNFSGRTYAGYKDSPEHWPQDQPKPSPINWYAGKQYDDDTTNAKIVLDQLATKYYPGASKGYKIVGFFWWQGDKDRYDKAYAMQYESNLVRLIRQLRIDFDAHDAKFVLATLGQHNKDNSTEPTAEPEYEEEDQLIFDAMMAVDGTTTTTRHTNNNTTTTTNNNNNHKYPDFVGNVATVYTFPLSRGGMSEDHYGENAETYMNVGEAMGKAMAELVMESESKS